MNKAQLEEKLMHMHWLRPLLQGYLDNGRYANIVDIVEITDPDKLDLMVTSFENTSDWPTAINLVTKIFTSVQYCVFAHDTTPNNGGFDTFQVWNNKNSAVPVRKNIDMIHCMKPLIRNRPAKYGIILDAVVQVATYGFAGSQMSTIITVFHIPEDSELNMCR